MWFKWRRATGPRLSRRAEATGLAAVHRDATRVEDVRSAWLFPALAASCVVVAAGLLYLNSYKNFYFDEWDFITAYRPGQSSTSIFFPHGEHWSTIPILIWKALFLVVGIRKHLPFQGIVVGAHVACVLAMFELVRRRSGDLPAFGAACLLLVLGTGSSEIVQAFQGNQTLSLAFGLAALLMVDAGRLATHWRILSISGLLLLSLMSSGLGLGFLIVIAVQSILEPRNRHVLLALVAPAVIYVGWFLAYGKIGSPCEGCPSALGDLRALGPAYIIQVAQFVAVGVSAGVTGLVGLTYASVPVPVIQVLFVAFALLLGWSWYIRGAQGWEIALIAGLVGQFALIGLARVYFGVQGAADPRYVYVAVIYLLPLAANAAKQLPWRLLWRPVWIGALTLTVVANATLLAQQSLAWVSIMHTENDELRVVELFRGAPDMQMNAPLDPVVIPQLTAARYYGAIDDVGSPVPPSVPFSLTGLDQKAVDQQLVSLFGPALTAEPSPGTSPTGSCQVVNSTAGAALVTQVQAGQSITLLSERGGDASFALGYFQPPTSRPSRTTQLLPGVPEVVRLPDTGRPIDWRLRATVASAGNLTICGAGTVKAHTDAGIFSAPAAVGQMDPAWRTVSDSAAYGGAAAVLPAGHVTTTWNDDFFGVPTAILPAAYDVWFRARVDSGTGESPEMTLGLFDMSSYSWLGSTQYSPRQIGTTYTWLRVAKDLKAAPGHHLVFVAEFNSHTGPARTTWHVDQGMVLPAGSATPEDLGVAPA